MREMISADGKTTLKVGEWIMLKNGWEYYLEESKDDVVFGLVLGAHDELGYVSKKEIAPYISSRVVGENLKSPFCAPMPAVGYSWADEEE
jgi:hypothetical protein